VSSEEKKRSFATQSGQSRHHQNEPHRGKGGWIDPAGKAIKEEVAILMVSGSYASIEAIAAIGKRMLDHTAIYVKKPDGSTILL
jgi:hypothetical protein